ncbi:fibroblast growth factor 11a [Tachysurus ichikawai]
MAALASSLIRQRREVKDPQANRQISNKRKPCPKSNKSLCQKQILILISKVRLCGSRGRKLEKRPEGEGPLELYAIMGEVMWNTGVLVRAAPLSPETT